MRHCLTYFPSVEIARAFRINESKYGGLQKAIQYPTNIENNGFSTQEREPGRSYLERLTRRIGPVVDSYPIWHPLMTSSRSKKYALIILLLNAATTDLIIQFYSPMVLSLVLIQTEVTLLKVLRR